MRRRAVLAGLAASTLARPALGQRAARRVGFVSWFSTETGAHLAQFRRGMQDLGYVEGRDIEVEGHFTAGDRERTREIVRKLVRDGADILVVIATPAIAVAKQEAPSLPIVMAMVSDPIAAGFAQSLSRPGGNLTGRTMFGPELAGKRIDMLREIRPSLRRVGYLGSSLDSNTSNFVRAVESETGRAGLALNTYLVDGPGKIDAALLDGIRRDQVEAVVVQPIFAGWQNRIVALANDAGLPVVADWEMFAEAGALLTYGIDTNALVRRAAYFVDRIFKGGKPADLPIEQPTETRLVINLVAAKRFGWAIPPTLVAQADEVIE